MSESLSGILLARHGETDDNREPLRFQGFRDTPLNDTGRRQAAELAERVAGDGIASLWSSDLSRASETAQIVGARIGLAATPGPSPARGKPRTAGKDGCSSTCSVMSPSATARGCARARTSGFPGGESLQDQQDRVTAALEEIHRIGTLPALVVCHGGSIRVMLCRRDPRGLDAFHEFKVPNVAVVPA